MNTPDGEIKLVVWKEEKNKWLWQIEENGKKIKGRNVDGKAESFQEAYSAAKKRLLQEKRKE